MSGARIQRRLSAILAADMVGYSRLMEADETGTIARQKTYRSELIDPEIAAHGGRIVKSTGDGILAEFMSVVEATECAVAIQRAMLEREAGVGEDRRIRYRIGINLGDIVIDDDDILGDGVNVAARLEGLAEPGGICISDMVHQGVAGKLDLAFDDLGPQKVKNISRAVHAYHVVLGQDGAASKPEPVARADKPSVAVLPFDNLSNDPEQDYFSDGMAEDLITDLSKISGLFVVARNSSFAFKGQSVEVREIGEQLGVKHILEGSVRKMGSRLRINAQLIDAASGGHLWAERYDGEMVDIFEFQDRIREEIVAALQVKLAPGDEALAERRSSASIEAHDLFLRARASYFKYTPEDHAAAKSYLEQAIALDPQFADAYSFLSYLYAAAWNLMYPGVEDGLERALQMAEKAISLDPGSAIAHMRLGWTLCFMRQFDRAQSCFETAVALGPDIAEVYFYYSVFLNYTGQPKQALEMIGKAYRLEPIVPTVWDIQVGYAYWELKRYDDAVVQFRKIIDRVPGFPMTYMFLASVYVELGRLDAAAEQLRSLRAMNPTWSVRHADRIFPILSDDTRKRFLDNLRQAGLPE